MSPEERQEALIGGLTIEGVLVHVLGGGLAQWIDDTRDEGYGCGISIGPEEMCVTRDAAGGVRLTIGTKTWCISAEEVEP